MLDRVRPRAVILPSVAPCLHMLAGWLVCVLHRSETWAGLDPTRRRWVELGQARLMAARPADGELAINGARWWLRISPHFGDTLTSGCTIADGGGCFEL